MIWITFNKAFLKTTLRRPISIQPIKKTRSLQEDRSSNKTARFVMKTYTLNSL